MVLNPKLKLVLEFLGYVGLTGFFLWAGSNKNVVDLYDAVFVIIDFILIIFFLGRSIDTWKKL